MTLKSRPIILSDYTHARRRQLSDGVSKTIYDGPEPDTHVLYFKDEVSLNNQVETISGKGILNNRISELLMSRINDLGIETHFIRTLNMREQLVRATEPLPFTITLHTIATGNFAKRLGLEDGMVLPKPIPEFSLRSPDLGNPVVAAEHLTALGWSRFEEIDEVIMTAQRIHDFLGGQFLALNMRLMSFSLDFGRFYTSDMMDTQLLIADELSLEKCNLHDIRTGSRLDLKGMEDCIEDASEIYQEVARRLGVLGLDQTDVQSSHHTQDISPQQRPGKSRPLTKRTNPHGHNSL